MPEEEKFDTEITYIKNGITSKKIIGGVDKKKSIVKRIFISIAVVALFVALIILDFWMYRDKDFTNDVEISGLIAFMSLGCLLGIVGLLLIAIPRQFNHFIHFVGKKFFKQDYENIAIPEGQGYRKTPKMAAGFVIAAVVSFVLSIFLSFLS